MVVLSIHTHTMFFQSVRLDDNSPSQFRAVPLAFSRDISWRANVIMASLLNFVFTSSGGNKDALTLFLRESADINKSQKKEKKKTYKRTKRLCRFLFEWHDEFPWLKNDEKADDVFCKPCQQYRQLAKANAFIERTNSFHKALEIFGKFTYVDSS